MASSMSLNADDADSDFILTFISYGHANGPLSVPNNPKTTKLVYSVRDVPNPPRSLRKKHIGTSRRLQKEIFLSKEGTERLEEIRKEVESEMNKMIETASSAHSAEMPIAIDEIGQRNSPLNLVVGIMCEEGRHRSVAFACELQRAIGKKADWAIEVRHRDLGGPASTASDDGDDGGSSTFSKMSNGASKRTIIKKRRARAKSVIPTSEEEL